MHKINDKFLFFEQLEADTLAEVLNSRQLSGTSALVEEYEGKLAAYFGVTYAVALSSGSAALHAALHVLGATDGSEVLVPATAPVPTLLPILTSRARPVFVDVMPGEFSFDPDDLRRKITRLTRAAIAVPSWGYPIRYRDTIDVLSSAGVPLLEDAAQAHGSVIEGKLAGTWGAIGCFSTHDRKLLSTGEGGFILTSDTQIYERVKEFSQLGNMDGIHYGVNYKLATLACALGMSRLHHLEDQIAARTANANTILAAITSPEIRELAVVGLGSRPNYYSLLLDIKARPPSVQRFIHSLAERGIPSDILRYRYNASYKIPLFSEFHRHNCVNAEDIVARITTIPVHPGLSERDISHIIESVVDARDELTP